MQRGGIGVGALLAGILLSSAWAQQPGVPRTPGSAQGTLSVTCTVATSVGLVIGPDGAPRMIVANAADPRDNVSKLEPVVMVKLTPAKGSGDGGPAKAQKKKR
jgi:hypothetical protein